VKRFARLLALVAGAVFAFAGIGLGLAHRQIRSIHPPLPDLDALRAFASAPELAIRVTVWNSATQPTPRAQVLDPERDPDPSQPYVMSHPVFVVEWEDGRVLLVDAGMDAAQAAAFGRPLAWVGGGAMTPHGSVGERVAPALAGRPLAIAFTHLHSDHVGGAVSLCAALPAATRLRLFQTPAQMDLVNYTTRPGRALVEAARCLAPERVADAPATALPDRPGAFVIHAAGHTPGSQIVGAWVRSGAEVRGFLFAGDAANAIDGIRRDVPKPWPYRTFVVPEDEGRLARVRALLRDAEASGMTVAIAHDERHLATTGIASFGD
jgi:glyoxylase-like metal-dependent hydrolase (beta-lactamase superfamily II)